MSPLSLKHCLLFLVSLVCLTLLNRWFIIYIALLAISEMEINHDQENCLVKHNINGGKNTEWVYILIGSSGARGLPKVGAS